MDICGVWRECLDCGACGPVSESVIGATRRWNKRPVETVRSTWRQLFWWLKSQLAMIDLGMVEAAEVLMPFMLGGNGESFFDSYKQKLLESGK